VNGAIQQLTEFLADPELTAANDPEIRAARRWIKETLHELQDRGFDNMARKHMICSGGEWNGR
jgi:hypothetical protein